MAFHPLRTFQKNRKFWMASILLVCMITFVLCTGLQGGDFGTWLMSLWGSRGNEVVRIDGKVYYQSDIENIKQKRELANEYMRRAAQLTIDTIQVKLKEPKTVGNEDQHRRNMILMFGIQQELAARISRPPYFPADPNSLDDLIAHLIMLHEADRLKIALTDESVRELVADEVFSYIGAAPFDQDAAARVQMDLRSSYGDRASYRRIVEALGDEFRARMARTALETYRTQRFDPLLNRARIASDSRMAVTPARMHDFWEKNRGEAEIAVIPLRVEQFLKNVRAPTEKELEAFFASHKDRRYDPTAEQPGFLMPEQVKIDWVAARPGSKFYKDAAHTATTLLITPPVMYSPMQPLHLTVATYVTRTADWNKRLNNEYERLRGQSSLRNPMMPAGLVTWKAPFWEPGNVYEVAPYWTPYFALPLAHYSPNRNLDPKQITSAVGASAPVPGVPGVEGARGVALLQAANFQIQAKEATQMATLVGAAAPALLGVPGVEGFQAVALLQTSIWKTQEKELAPLIEYERGKRIPVGVTLVGLGASQNLLGTAGVWFHVASGEHFQPLLGTLKDRLHRSMEAKIAQDWVNANMIFVKDQLERRGGNAFQLEDGLRQLERLFPGLERGSSKVYRNKFDIDRDSALEPLRAAYDSTFHLVNQTEGRGGTPNMLKPEDFHRLFFGAETFSVGNVDTYRPKPWPPTVTVKPKDIHPLMQLQRRQQPSHLFDSASQPFLFWKTAHQPARTAKELKEVRKEVEHAWKVKQARAALMPDITRVATELEKALKDPKIDLWTVASDAARRHGAQAMKLQNVAPLVPRRADDKGPLQFVPFEVDRDKFLYPTADLAKQLLSLRDLQKPLTTGHGELDKLNQTLFDRLGKGSRVVQVLTNQPRTEFYVVVQLGEPRATTEAFFAAYMGAQGQEAQRNLFLDTCQADYAREFHRQLMDQLYSRLRVEVDEQARKQFDERAKKKD